MCGLWLGSAIGCNSDRLVFPDLRVDIQFFVKAKYHNHQILSEKGKKGIKGALWPSLILR